MTWWPTLLKLVNGFHLKSTKGIEINTLKLSFLKVILCQTATEVRRMRNTISAMTRFDTLYLLTQNLYLKSKNMSNFIGILVKKTKINRIKSKEQKK